MFRLKRRLSAEKSCEGSLEVKVETILKSGTPPRAQFASIALRKMDNMRDRRRRDSRWLDGTNLAIHGSVAWDGRRP